MNAANPWPSYRVLYVDDNRDIADSAVMLLRAVGFEARASYSGMDALRQAESFRPSVCLIDLQMPGMDGDEVAVQLVNQPWCPLLLVAVTARNDEVSRSRITKAGFHLHLVKPVDPHQLISVVDTLFLRAGQLPVNDAGLQKIARQTVTPFQAVKNPLPSIS